MSLLTRRTPARAGARWTAVLLAAVRLAAATAATAAGVPAAVAAGSAAAPGVPAAPPAMAILCFVAAAGGEGLPAEPARLRAEAAAALGAALQARGHATPLPAPVLPWQREWRVRQALALPSGFVAALAGRAGAQRLLVAQLVAADGRLLLAARCLSPATGLVTWADLADAPLPATPDTAAIWRRTLPALAATLADRWREPPARADADTLGVLPTTALGCHAWEAEAATCALLRALLTERRHHLPDPGLLAASLQEEGLPASDPGLAALQALARRHGSSQLLLSQLQALSPAAQAAGPAPGLPESSVTPPGAQSALVLAARVVAAGDGIVAAAAVADSPPPPATGWFGTTRAYSPARRLAQAGHDIVSRCRAHREDT